MNQEENIFSPGYSSLKFIGFNKVRLGKLWIGLNEKNKR